MAPFFYIYIVDKNIVIYILGYISAIGTIIPLIFGILRFKYLNRKYFIILILFGIGTLTELATRVYSSIINHNNIWIFNIYQIIETILIIAFYSSVTKNKIKKNILLLIAIIFSGISIYHIFTNKSNMLNDSSFSTESVIVVLLAILTFNSILKKQIYSNILAAPLFWFNSAFLLFFFGNLFLHIFSKYLQEHALYTFFELWGIWHSSLNIIFYILISIGFWKTKISQI